MASCRRPVLHQLAAEPSWTGSPVTGVPDTTSAARRGPGLSARCARATALRAGCRAFTCAGSARWSRPPMRPRATCCGRRNSSLSGSLALVPFRTGTVVSRHRHPDRWRDSGGPRPRQRGLGQVAAAATTPSGSATAREPQRSLSTRDGDRGRCGERPPLAAHEPMLPTPSQPGLQIRAEIPTSC